MMRNSLIFITGIIILILLAIFSMYIGRYPITLDELFHFIFTNDHYDSNLPVILLNIRLPRIISAIAIGGALSIAGAAYQGMFRNPMVSPDILGVTSGAGLGASAAILYSFPLIIVQLFSFIGGLSSVFLAVSVSRCISKSKNAILILVLSGMVISSLCGAMLSMIKYVADPDDKLPAITYWLMGSLSDIKMSDLYIVLPIILIGSVPLILVGWQLNILSFGDDEAKSLGINTSLLRTIVIICASLVTASVVSISGIIGWVGLIIPHITRMIVGPNHQVLIPASFLCGSIFLLLVDNIVRSISAVEIPIGILTAIIGTPFFIFFLNKSKLSW
jgi:iron complex transport system permease protein